jgi:putative RecB family exonuclease
MTLPVPVSLSPTAIGNFAQCGKLFQFANIERLEQPPTIDQVRGIIVHDALFRLFWHHPPGERTILNAIGEFCGTWDDALAGVRELVRTEADRAIFSRECEDLIARLYELEDPDSITPIGLELKVQGTFDGVHPIRGIIDRLELESDGTYTVTDYKTGKAPSKAHLMARLRGVAIYAALVEDMLDIEVGKVQLLCLGGKSPERVAVRLSDTQMENAKRRVNAVWIAVEDACRAESFIANPGPLCGWCAFRDRCPDGDAYLTARGK